MTCLGDRFQSFVKTLEGFEDIESVFSRSSLQGRRADYLFQNRGIIVEQKVLTSNPLRRPQRFVEKLARERGFVYFGRLSSQYLFSRQPDPDSLQRRLVLDIAKIIDDDVANADKQTANTRTQLNIPDAVGILVILNQNAVMLAPDIIRYALSNSYLKKTKAGSQRYRSNDGVILISEAHTVSVPVFGHVAFPMYTFTCPKTERKAEVVEFSEMLQERWAAFNNIPFVRLGS